MTSSARKNRGFTLVELLVVILIISVLIGLLLPALASAQRAARRTQCANNMRSLNVGLFQYANDYGDCIPSVSVNVYGRLGPYMGEAPDRDAGGEVWRCPEDKLIPSTYRNYWYSYVAAADQETRDFLITCFGSGAGVANKMSNIQADTIAWMEGWSPCELGETEGDTMSLRSLDLDLRDTAWFEHVPEGGEVVHGPETPPPDGTKDYAYDAWFGDDKDNDVALYDCQDDDKFYAFDEDGNRTLNPDRGDVYLPSEDYIGEYLFTWGYCSRYTGKSVLIADAFHDGQVNVAFIGGDVQSMYLRAITMAGFDSPVDNPMWTRDAD